MTHILIYSYSGILKYFFYELYIPNESIMYHLNALF